MKKQKERLGNTFKRRRPLREPYDLVLIVCEGEKTEPLYFTALRNKLRLSSTNICIAGKECGSSPRSVVEYAYTKLRENNSYDRIYCVFDKDRHEGYQGALDSIRTKKFPARVKVSAITSVPCFEVWLLLHFVDVSRSYVESGSNSPCDNVIQDLKSYILNYGKGQSDIFEISYTNIGDAITRAKKLEKKQEADGTDNPSTKVHNLVEYLHELKRSQEKGAA